MADRSVRLEFDVQQLDRYGRTLAYVYLEDGTFVNAWLAAGSMSTRTGSGRRFGIGDGVDRDEGTRGRP